MRSRLRVEEREGSGESTVKKICEIRKRKSTDDLIETDI